MPHHLLCQLAPLRSPTGFDISLSILENYENDSNPENGDSRRN